MRKKSETLSMFMKKMMMTTHSWQFTEKSEALSKFLPQGRRDPGDFKPDSAKPLFLDHDEDEVMKMIMMILSSVNELIIYQTGYSL